MFKSRQQICCWHVTNRQSWNVTNQSIRTGLIWNKIEARSDKKSKRCLRLELFNLVYFLFPFCKKSFISFCNVRNFSELPMFASFVNVCKRKVSVESFSNMRAQEKGLVAIFKDSFSKNQGIKILIFFELICIYVFWNVIFKKIILVSNPKQSLF